MKNRHAVEHRILGIELASARDARDLVSYHFGRRVVNLVEGVHTAGELNGDIRLRVEIAPDSGANEAATPGPEAVVARLKSAIRWALGMEGDFPSRPPHAGAFYWRGELSRRAGIPIVAPGRVERTIGMTAAAARRLLPGLDVEDDDTVEIIVRPGRG